MNTSARLLPTLAYDDIAAALRHAEPANSVELLWSFPDSLAQAYRWRGTVTTKTTKLDGTGRPTSSFQIMWYDHPQVDGPQPFVTTLPMRQMEYVARELCVYAAAASSPSTPEESQPSQPSAFGSRSDHFQAVFRATADLSSVQKRLQNLERQADAAPKPAVSNVPTKPHPPVKLAQHGAPQQPPTILPPSTQQPTQTPEPASTQQQPTKKQPRAVTVPVGVQCVGECGGSFACVLANQKHPEMTRFARECQVQGKVQQATEMMWRWLMNHNVVPMTTVEHSDKCQLQNERVHLRQRTAYIQCTSRKCRHTKTLCEDDVPGHVPTMVAFFLWVGSCAKIGKFPQSHFVCKEVMNTWVAILCDMATLFKCFHLCEVQGKFDASEGDEAFWGQRKFGRGKRVRDAGVETIMGVVRVEIDPLSQKRTVLDALIQHVQDRKRQTTNSLLIHVTHARSIINTDSASMYRDLTTVRPGADTVNHTIQFAKVTEGGTVVHSNSMEGHWAKLKGVLRQLWSRQCTSREMLGCRMQLANFLWGCGHASVSRPAGLLALFVWYRSLIRVHGQTNVNQVILAAKKLMVVSDEKFVEDSRQRYDDDGKGPQDADGQKTRDGDEEEEDDVEVPASDEEVEEDEDAESEEVEEAEEKPTVEDLDDCRYDEEYYSSFYEVASGPAQPALPKQETPITTPLKQAKMTPVTTAKAAPPSVVDHDPIENWCDDRSPPAAEDQIENWRDREKSVTFVTQPEVWVEVGGSELVREVE
jgi:hypothetical protein